MSSALHLSRRDDREIALALLYEADMTGDSINDVLHRQVVAPEEYAEEIVNGVFADGSDVDETIDLFAKDWTVDRMGGIDRAILRIGVWELLYSPEVPATAVLSEAVALAHQYSTEKSAPFINGILAAVRDEHL